MPRYLEGREVRITHSFEQDEGFLLNPFSVTVEVYDATGALHEAGSASENGGLWDFTLAGFPPKGEYDVLWIGKDPLDVVVATDTDSFEVTGAKLFTVAQARADDYDLQDETQFPTPEITEKRTTVEQEFERITGRSYVPRRVRVRVEHDGCSEFVKVPFRDVTGFSNVVGPDDINVDETELNYDADGFIGGFGALEAGFYEISVDFGLKAAPPGIRRVGIIYLRHLLHEENSAIPERTTSYQPQDGSTYTFGNGVSEGTGIPAVDAVLFKESEKIIGDIYGGAW